MTTEPKAGFKAAAGPKAEPKKEERPSVNYYLETQKKEIKAALPKHMDVEKFKRIALTELRKNPTLDAVARANPLSFFGACVQAAQLGLEPGSGMGYCYLVPFGQEVTLIPGYKGMIELIERTDKFEYFINQPVLVSDPFTYRIETPVGVYLHHEPDLETETIMNDENLRLIYCLAKRKGGGVIPELMTRQMLINHERQHRKGKNMSDAWKNSWMQMARKTVIRRIMNYLPKSTEMQRLQDVHDDNGKGMADFARSMGLDKIPERVDGDKSVLTSNAGEADEEHSAAREVEVDDIGENVLDAETTDPALNELVSNAKAADAKGKRG